MQQNYRRTPIVGTPPLLKGGVESFQNCQSRGGWHFSPRVGGLPKVGGVQIEKGGFACFLFCMCLRSFLLSICDDDRH